MDRRDSTARSCRTLPGEDMNREFPVPAWAKRHPLPTRKVLPPGRGAGLKTVSTVPNSTPPLIA